MHTHKKPQWPRNMFILLFVMMVHCIPTPAAAALAEDVMGSRITVPIPAPAATIIPAAVVLPERRPHIVMAVRKSGPAHTPAAAVFLSVVIPNPFSLSKKYELTLTNNPPNTKK